MIGYTFRDKELLKTCFTHKTYANNCGGESNERLEFLGDAVLGLVVSENLYHGRGKAMEGKLTDLRKGYVSEFALTPLTEELDLMRFLRYSGKEEELEGKTKSDLFEALVAGIYLDGGMEAAQSFLSRTLKYRKKPDYISELQEYAQAHGEREPRYSYTEEDTDHIKTYIAHVTVQNVSAEGIGKNKKQAKAQAAEHLLKKLKERQS